MYQEILYSISILSGGLAYILKTHGENNNVKRPECHKAQDKVIGTLNTRIDDLKEAMNTRFDDVKDLIRNNGK